MTTEVIKQMCKARNEFIVASVSSNQEDKTRFMKKLDILQEFIINSPKITDTYKLVLLRETNKLKLS